ncbi:MAG TPA: Hpt domain-containing protein [Aurantimonas sp.]|jgi:HPt (histidine-containing phosphotransfer) domain-containing protein|nr:Hpt domain-containing protein [Aurantimonas sp.]
MLLAPRRKGDEKAGSAGEAVQCPSRRRPIDLVHLARQTSGDRTLEADVLGMLGRQLDTLLLRLDTAPAGERRQIAHALKGTARNIGAFRLADCAERFEDAVGDAAALAHLRQEAEAAAKFARFLID